MKNKCFQSKANFLFLYVMGMSVIDTKPYKNASLKESRKVKIITNILLVLLKVKKIEYFSLFPSSEILAITQQEVFVFI